MDIQKLPVNYQDDVIDTSVNEERQYQQISNDNGTISLKDVTVYEKVGSLYGAEDINKTNQTVNELIDEMGKTESVFVLKNQATLTFSENICTITDSRITADSLADVYFTKDTSLNAEKASIDVETYSGRLELTAGRMPEGEIKASIVVRVV